MEIYVGKYFVPELPHLAYSSKTSFSKNLRLKKYPWALESIDVFDSGWKMEELCRPFLYQICQGNIKKLNIKDRTLDPD